MVEEVLALSARVNDFKITVSRTKGVWDCEFVGFPLPKDIHNAQRRINDTYRGQRRKIAANFRQSKQAFKELEAAAEVAKRDIERDARNKLGTPKEKQGVNDAGTGTKKERN